MKNFFKWLFASKIRLAILLIIILAAGFFGYKKFSAPKAQTSYVLGQATKQTIITAVTGTGQVSQDRSVTITPPGAGKLTSVNVKQGQAVKAGQVIAVLDETNNTMTLNQAKAGLASAQASYDEVMAGATPQDIQLAQLNLQSDQQALDTANANLQTVTKQQQQNVANALTTMLNSGLQAIPSGGNGGNGTVAITGTYASTTQGTYTITIYNTGGGLQYVVSGLETDTAAVTKNVPVAMGKLGLYMTFAGNIFNGDTWTVNIPNTMSSSYAGNMNSYQNALLSQQSAIASAQNQIASAQNKLQQDQINLEVKQEPPTDQQVESAKASLLAAQAQLQNAQLAYSNNMMTSPFDGTVAALNNQTGDQVTASTEIATVVTNHSLAVIPLNEVDVSKVKVGDKATMTFDAVDGLTITGEVAEVDNIGTVSQGVVNYNVKLSFDTEDDRVKPGMSVNASIITDIQADVLAVPNAAIKTAGTRTYVEELDASSTESAATGSGVISKTAPAQVTVTTGASDDNYTQILSGLNESDSIVVQTINSSTAKSAASSATSATNLLRGVTGGGGGGAVRFNSGGGASRTVGGGG